MPLKRFGVAVLSGLVITSGQFDLSPARATASKIDLSINNVQVEAKSATKHVVSMTGTFINQTGSEQPSVRISLGVSSPIYTRSQLASIRQNPHQEYGRDVGQIRTELTDIAPNTQRTWKIRFVAENTFGTEGVFAIGARATTGNLTQQTYTTIPWFGSGKSIRATKVAILVPVTTLATRLTKKIRPPEANEVDEVNRLNALTSGLVATRLSPMVDPSVNDWIRRFPENDVNVPFTKSLTELSTNIGFLGTTSANVLYGNANIAALSASGKTAEIKGIRDLTPDSRLATLFRAPLGSVDKSTWNMLAKTGVTPILRNESISDNAQSTTFGIRSLAGKTILVADTSASNCLKNIIQADDYYSISSCLLSEIAMMTAESPQLARTIVVVAPSLWRASSADLKKLDSMFTPWSGAQLITARSLLNEGPLPLDAEMKFSKPYPASTKVLASTQRIAQQTNLVGSLIANSDWTRQYRKARYVGHSLNWPSKALNLNYLSALNRQLTNMSDSVQIQAAGRVTVSTTKTDIPITVANFGQYPAHVRIYLATSAAGQLTSEPSSLQIIPVGQRVTIPIKVEVKGTGVIHTSAEILNPRGQRIGVPKKIDISATAYQKFASALVKIAFALLLLLAINNFIRRRRPAKSQE